MKKFLVFFTLFFFLGGFHAQGAPAPSLKKIKDELGEKSAKATSIAASITSLEKELGKVNNKYLERSSQNRSLEEKVARLAKEIESSYQDLKARENQARKLARKYALEALDHQDENALLKKTVLKRLASQKLKKLTTLKTQADNLRQTFEIYAQRLQEARRDEESLYELIVDLENKKKDLSQEYISSLEIKNEWEEKLENALAKRKAYAKVQGADAKRGLEGLELISPMENFVDYKGGAKGVTYKYDSRAPIFATAGGKVVYSGELASYGKVVMLDHGSQVRSVILGDIQIKAKKGDHVSRGQIIGYTMAEPGITKSLYYEIRKKNVAQNTLALLKKNQSIANL